MNHILCIETGTSTCSVALGYDDFCLDVEESNDPNNNHARNLTQFIEDLLKRQGIKPKDLAAVAVSKGPGSYTGLRIGVSAAKGICYGANIPLIAVGSLYSMAQGAIAWLAENKNSYKPDLLCPMIDARRMEVYTQLFNMSLQQKSSVDAKILDEKSYADLLEDQKILFFGNGSVKAKAIVNHTNSSFINDFKPSARFMLEYASRLYKLKRFEDVAYFEPLYLKDFVATIAKNKVLGSS